jgi:hypothetical protein
MRLHKNPLTLYDRKKFQKENLGKHATDKLSILLSLIVQPGRWQFKLNFESFDYA